MNFTLSWLFLYIVSIVPIYLQFTIITLIFNTPHNYKKLLFVGALLSLINCIPLLVVNYPQSLASASLLLYLIISLVFYILLFKYRILKSILSICMQLVLALLIEYLSLAIILMLYPKMSFQQIASAPIFTQGLYRFVPIIVLSIIALLVHFLKIRVDLPKDKNRKSIISIILNFLITISLILPNMLFMEINTVNAPRLLIRYNLACIILLFMYNIYTIIMYNTLDSKRIEIESQKLYIDTLEASLDKLRSFKHDFANIFQSIMGYVQLENIDKLKVFLQQLQYDVAYIDTVSPISNYLKKYPALYGILLSKISIAEMESIYFNLNISKELNLEKVRMYDLCKMIGVLLDNALEACRETSDRRVVLDIDQIDDSSTRIIISNTYKEVDMHKIFEKGYTSKSNHTGFGLWEVKALVNKYNTMFELSTNADSVYFSQTLTIKNA